MSTDTSTDIEIKELIESAFDEDAVCELGHSEHSPIHEGPAKWYMSARCTRCGHSATSLICNPYRNAVLAHLGEFANPCRKCGKQDTIRNLLVSIVKRS